MNRRILATLASVWLPAVVSASNWSNAENAIASSGQLIAVTAQHWTDSHGTVELLERAPDRSWRRASPDLPVTLGRNGVAWGIGLHTEHATKREGDGRSPAGVFELERIYGRDSRSPSRHFPYQQLSPQMEGIDDPRSRFYNRLVDPSKVPVRDWVHSEKVRPVNPMFRWCIGVKHNWQQRPNFGSCIYLHIWKAPGMPTSGCTAMDATALERIVRWLDAEQKPLLIQLPAREMQMLRLQ